MNKIENLQDQSTLKTYAAKLMTAPTMLAASISVAFSSQAAAENWDYNAEAFYTGGSDRWYAGGRLLYPLVQSSNSLTYADLRLTRARHTASEVNVGLGHRVLQEKGILGGYVALDRRNSENSNSFNQVTVGLEYLTDSWDFNLNVYDVRTEEDVDIQSNKSTVVSTSQTSSTDTSSVVTGSSFIGNQLEATTATTVTTTLDTITNSVATTTTRTTYEEALSGHDVEIGYRLPMSQDYETRLYVAAYEFESDYAPDDADGTRVRIEFRPRKNIEFGVSYQDDDLNGIQSFGSISYSFGYSSEAGVRSLSERMVEFHERDIDVVTTSNMGDDGENDHLPSTVITTEVDRNEELGVVSTSTTSTTALVDDNNDGVIDDIIHIDNSYTGGDSDGSVLKPFVSFDACYAGSACTSADIIYVHQGDSAEAGSEYTRQASITLEAGQQLIGEGTDFYTQGGDAHPVLQNPTTNHSLVVIDDNNTVAGLQLEVTGSGADTQIARGIYGLNARNAEIYDNRIIGTDVGSPTTGIFLKFEMGKRNSGIKSGASARIENNFITGMAENSGFFAGTAQENEDGHGVLVVNRVYADGEYDQTLHMSGNTTADNDENGIAVFNYISNYYHNNGTGANATLDQNIDLSNVNSVNNGADGVYVLSFAYVGATGIATTGLNENINLTGANLSSNGESGIHVEFAAYADGENPGLYSADDGVTLFSNLTMDLTDATINLNSSGGVYIESDVKAYWVDNAVLRNTLDLTLDNTVINLNYMGVYINMDLDTSMGNYIDAVMSQDIQILNSSITNNDGWSGVYLSSEMDISGGIAHSVMNWTNVNVYNSHLDNNSGGLSIYNNIYLGESDNESTFSNHVVQYQKLNVVNSTINGSDSNGIYLTSAFDSDEVTFSTIERDQMLRVVNSEINTDSHGVYVYNSTELDSYTAGTNTLDNLVSVYIADSQISTNDGSMGVHLEVDTYFNGQRSDVTELVDVDITRSNISNTGYSGVYIETYFEADDFHRGTINRMVDIDITNSTIADNESRNIYIEDGFSLDFGIASYVTMDFDLNIYNVDASQAHWSDGIHVELDRDVIYMYGGMFTNVDRTTLDTVDVHGSQSFGVYIEYDFELESSALVTASNLNHISLNNVNADNTVWSNGIEIDIEYETIGVNYYAELSFTDIVEIRNTTANNAYSTGIYIETDFDTESNTGALMNIDFQRLIVDVEADGARTAGLYIDTDMSLSYESDAVINISNITYIANSSFQGPSNSGNNIDIYIEVGGNYVTANLDRSLVVKNTAFATADYAGLYLDNSVGISSGYSFGTVTDTSVVRLENNTFRGYSFGLDYEEDFSVGSSSEEHRISSNSSVSIVGNEFRADDSDGLEFDWDMSMGSSSDYNILNFTADLVLTDNVSNQNESVGFEIEQDFSMSSSTDDNIWNINNNVYIARNEAVGNGSDGLQFEREINFNGSYNGISVQESIVLANNNFSQNESFGAYIELYVDSESSNSLGMTQNVQITGNAFDSNGSDGLYLSNEFSGSVEVDVTVLVDGNSAQDNEYYGMYITTDVYNSMVNQTMTISNNLFNRNESGGLYVEADVWGTDSIFNNLLTISNNEMNANGSHGLQVDFSVGGTYSETTFDFSVLNNTMNDNYYAGLYLDISLDGTSSSLVVDGSIQNNEMSRNDESGVYVDVNSSSATSMLTMDVLFSNNTMQFNSGDGVEIDMRAHEDNEVLDASFVFKNNEMSNNNGNGLAVYQSAGVNSEVVLNGNNISNNLSHGVYLMARIGNDDDAVVQQVLKAKAGSNTINENGGYGVMVYAYVYSGLNSGGLTQMVNLQASGGNTDNEITNNVEGEIGVYATGVGTPATQLVTDEDGNAI